MADLILLKVAGNIEVNMISTMFFVNEEGKFVENISLNERVEEETANRPDIACHLHFFGPGNFIFYQG